MKPFDSNGSFCAPKGELTRLAVQGAGATVFSAGAALAVTIVATVVLARILTPRDFGVVAMVTTVSLLLVNFGVNGFTEAVLQQEEMDHGLASNLFWVNIGAGVLLSLGFAATGHLLAWFYHDPVVRYVTWGMSLTIVIGSTSVIHLALLKRAMRFPIVSANDIVVRIASVAVSITLALAGWGYWALIAGAIATPIAQTVGAWYLCRWVPGLPRRVEGTASMIRFALRVYGRFSVNYFARNMDNLLVGWHFGAHSLGFYKKAYDLFGVPAGQFTAPLTNVAVSALSRLKRASIEYRQSIVSAVAVLAFLGMGLGADFTLVGKDLIRLLLGPKWDESGRIFTLFAPGIGVMLLYNVTGWIHLSIGRADRWLRWGIFESTFTILLFLLALPWGAGGIALAWTASYWILVLPAFWYAGRPIGMDISPVVGTIGRYLLAALLSGCASTWVIRLIPSVVLMPGAAGALTRIVVMSGLVGAFYVGAVILLHWGYAPILQIVDLLRQMLPAGGAKQSLLERDIALAQPESPSVRPVPSFKTQPSDVGVPPGSSGLAVTGAVEEPLVSILIPAFNAEEWIADTLRSALGQTWRRKEILVVDDGSTDQTVAVARKFESQGVRVITQKNRGAAAARNKAFSLCSGDYIQWLDADDLLAPDKISRQLEALKGHHGGRMLLSSPWGIFMYRYYRTKFEPTSLWCDLSPVDWLLSKMGKNLYMQTATWLVSRELTEAAGPWDPRLMSDDDGEYFCRVLLASEGVVFVPEGKTYYRGPGLAFRSLSYIGESRCKLDALWLSIQLHIGYLRSLEDSERVRKACLTYLQTSYTYFYPEMENIVKQADQLAKELGGRLIPPSLSWKYSWIKTLFGWYVAKKARAMLTKFRWQSKRALDRALYRVDGSRMGLTHEFESEPSQILDGIGR